MKHEYADEYGDLEVSHWWFRARRVILRSLLERLPFPPQPRIVEIGCGSGANLYELYPRDAVLCGVEPYAPQADRARTKGPIPIFTAEAQALPPELENESLDVITMFDVLEHIEDDRATLDYLRGKLKPGGWLVLSVPAFAWLHGRQDEVSHHFRRYARPDLKEKLVTAGFDVERTTYFNTVLFPPIALLRLLAKLRAPAHRGTGSDFDYQTGAFDGLLYGAFACERHLLRLMNLPFGISLFAAARKRGSTGNNQGPVGPRSR